MKKRLPRATTIPDEWSLGLIGKASGGHFHNEVNSIRGVFDKPVLVTPEREKRSGRDAHNAGTSR